MPRSPIAIVSADWHLDRPDRGAWRRRPEIFGDSCYALSQIVDLCLDRRLPLLAAGDLFDVSEQDDTSAIQYALQEIDRLSDSKLPLHYIQGQHEQLRNSPWLSLHPWPNHVNRKHFDLAGITCLGFDFTPKDALNTVFSAIDPTTTVLMMHQVWINIMGEAIGGECDFNQIPYAKLLITGDRHRHHVWTACGATGQALTVLSPGSTHMRTIDESELKYVFLLYDDLTFESLPLNSRQVFRYQLMTKEDLSNLIKALPSLETPTPNLPSDLAKPIIHVIYDPGISDVYRKLHAVSQDRFHLFLYPRSAVLSAADPDEAKFSGPVAVTTSVESVLERRLPKASVEYPLASQLLSCVDPVSTLDRFEEEFFNVASLQLQTQVPSDGTA